MRIGLVNAETQLVVYSRLFGFKRDAIAQWRRRASSPESPWSLSELLKSPAMAAPKLRL